MSTKRTLIIVENLSVPFDRRVWQEATTLRNAGWEVSVICPQGWGHTAPYEELDGIHIYRHPLPLEASGLLGFALEYSSALFWELLLSLRVLRRHGFDVVHACNPPDLLFLIGGFYKLFFHKRFLFDHHDISPELYEAKFGKRGAMHRLLTLLERLTFRTADVSLATNESFKRIAVERGSMNPDDVWVVRSYPDLNKFHRVPADPALKDGRRILAGYVGVIGSQDGVDHLIEAVAHIVHDLGRRDIGCMIIGDGPDLANVRSLAARLDVEPYVRFTGFLTGEALLRHLSSIDVGVIPDPPNSYNDKISMNKVFEYMSLGVPFVQYDLTEGRIAGGEAGLVAQGSDGKALAEALVTLADDEQARQAMSRAGLEAAKHCSWQEESAALLAAYESVWMGRTAAAPKRALPRRRQSI